MQRIIHLLSFISILVLAACASDGSSTDTMPMETADCRKPGQECPAGNQCVPDINGQHSCVRDRINVEDGGVSNSDEGINTPLSDGGQSTPADGGEPAGDMGIVEVPDCETTCRDAIACLYSEALCRLLTPGEDRDVTNTCQEVCDGGGLDRAVLAGAACDVRAEAVLRAVNDLTLLCGIATEGQACTSASGNSGICVPGDACTGDADDDKCLGDSVCCSGIACGEGGACTGAGACDGQMVAADCPGMNSVCCVEYAEVAGACDDDGQCASGECATEAMSVRPTPDGFCETPCENDNACGAGAICLSSGGVGICMRECDAETPCREGWFCTNQRRRDAAGEEVVVSVCLTDCRNNGCGVEGICNAETGICELMLEEAGACPYACGEGENCVEERCIRLDNTCETEYNCPINYECVDGACRTGTFAECQPLDLDSCAEGQTCVRTNDGGAFCIVTCMNDEVCPLHMSCQAILGVGQPNACYYTFCEEEQLNGACLLGESNGTCRPLVAGAAQPGICLAAGTAAAGEACDSEADPRTMEGALLSCVPGSLCSGDTDDSLDPANENEERGVCRPLCQVGGAGACGEDQACVQLGRPDDPNTMENELFNMGLCFETDCTLLGDQCADGSTCQPISFGANFGTCREVGQLGLGEACEDNSDCGSNTICGNAGSGPICIPFCDFQEQSCPWGQSCVPLNGGAVHACL